MCVKENKSAGRTYTQAKDCTCTHMSLMWCVCSQVNVCTWLPVKCLCTQAGRCLCGGLCECMYLLTGVSAAIDCRQLPMTLGDKFCGLLNYAKEEAMA